MMRKARLAIRKVNVALDSPGYCFGTGRSLKLVCFPASLAATHRGLALITRTARCLRQLPSCVAVYPRDSQSRRVLFACPKSSIRPLGFPIYVARRPAVPFARCFPRSFTLITRTARCLRQLP